MKHLPCNVPYDLLALTAELIITLRAVNGLEPATHSTQAGELLVPDGYLTVEEAEEAKAKKEAAAKKKAEAKAKAEEKKAKAEVMAAAKAAKEAAAKKEEPKT